MPDKEVIRIFLKDMFNKALSGINGGNFYFEVGKKYRVNSKYRVNPKETPREYLGFDPCGRSIGTRCDFCSGRITIRIKEADGTIGSHCRFNENGKPFWEPVE